MLEPGDSKLDGFQNIVMTTFLWVIAWHGAIIIIIIIYDQIDMIIKSDLTKRSERGPNEWSNCYVVEK